MNLETVIQGVIQRVILCPKRSIGVAGALYEFPKARVANGNPLSLEPLCALAKPGVEKIYFVRVPGRFHSDAKHLQRLLSECSK